MCYFGTNPMKFECAIKMKWWKMWNRPVEKYLWQFWNKSNRKWVHWESGHLWGAARSALATFWIDLHKFGQCKRLTCHTAQGIELCHVGLQCIFMMLGAVEEKLPALEGFGSPTNIYVSRGTWLGLPLPNYFCPFQLNRWPCHSLTQSLTVLLLLTYQRHL